MLKTLIGALTGGIISIFVIIGVVIIVILGILALIATFIKPILTFLLIAAVLYGIIRITRWRLSIRKTRTEQ